MDIASASWPLLPRLGLSRSQKSHNTLPKCQNGKGEGEECEGAKASGNGALVKYKERITRAHVKRRKQSRKIEREKKLKSR
jgi:hypothetical protein